MRAISAAGRAGRDISPGSVVAAGGEWHDTVHFVIGAWEMAKDYPSTLGSYASAEPGAYPLRQELRETVADRIWFAGEACSVEEWATVAGAHKTGLSTAGRVLSALEA